MFTGGKKNQKKTPTQYDYNHGPDLSDDLEATADILLGPLVKEPGCHQSLLDNDGS